MVKSPRLEDVVRGLQTYKDDIACNIHAYRNSCGLTQQQLADIAGVARSSVSTLEQGLGNPSLDSLHAIAHALSIDIETLLESVTEQI